LSTSFVQAPERPASRRPSNPSVQKNQQRWTRAFVAGRTTTDRGPTPLPRRSPKASSRITLSVFRPTPHVFPNIAPPRCGAYGAPAGVGCEAWGPRRRWGTQFRSGAELPRFRPRRARSGPAKRPSALISGPARTGSPRSSAEACSLNAVVRGAVGALNGTSPRGRGSCATASSAMRLETLPRRRDQARNPFLNLKKPRSTKRGRRPPSV